ncbi:hypothetical protein E1A91_D10G157900v1 [Gossypium mustelinum]|uniref:Uncharacterized protein n=1 Tax=Gossypium mustelinum TaxID=34275 RepID=A0A5D2T7E2_GOSMU|nr:hypothetical protein E1A91_D10G157900v1 [Gossypium mustelinum]TYI61219.1 hypothetical protein E1A91_D10G157900v1 [Gossypium mustelinum]
MKATCCRQLHIYRKEDLLSWYHHYYLAKPKITLLMMRKRGKGYG